ncbi:hypothetical protein OIO90_005364 [Microbotryomycetes sp. JL221]|nr:hypothetical protein OIO90_005364 [Microbotryomycetes sp. JL221]
MASLDDFVLASVPLASASTAINPNKRSWLSTIEYVDYPKLDTRVCLTCSHQGINVYDSTDQTPLSSITVGPSFSPTTGACSRSQSLTTADSIRTKGVRSTWVAVEVAADDDQAQSATGRTSKAQIWRWTEDERRDGSTEADPSKTIYPISSRIAGLLAPRTLPNHLLILTDSGTLALATADNMGIIASVTPPATTPQLTIVEQRMTIFPVSSTKPLFLPNALRPLLPERKGAHLVMVVRKFDSPSAQALSATPSAGNVSQAGKQKFKKTKRPSSAAVIDEADSTQPQVSSSAATFEGETTFQVEVILIDPEVQVEDEMEAQPRIVTLARTQLQALHVVVSEAGIVTALASGGALSSFRLDIKSAVWPMTWPEVFSSPLETSGTLTPIKTIRLSAAAFDMASAQLLALHSSFVILAAVRPQQTNASDESPVVNVVVWDVRLSAVITSTKVAIPQAISPTRQVTLTLALPSTSLATLALSPRTVSPSAPDRLAVFGLPLDGSSGVPKQSVLAAIVGKHALTRQYIVDDTTVVEKAQQTEPLRHPRTSKAKEAFLNASEQARRQVLARLAAILTPADEGHDAGVEQAEQVFDKFVKHEKHQLDDYNLTKLRNSTEKEQQRRLKALKDRDSLKPNSKKYAAAKRRIDDLIQERQEQVEQAGSAAEFSWKEVTSKRIKGVSDVFRYQYYDERKALEVEMGKVTTDQSFDKAVKAAKLQQPAFPQTFVSAVLRLCFPWHDTVSSSRELVVAPTNKLDNPVTRRHPAQIVSYLLDRRLAGDSQLPNGLTRALIEQGDWANVHKALRSMSDIPESTTVHALKLVSSAVLDPTSVAEMSSPCPPLEEFLSAFVEAPSTASTLRSEIAKQLSGALAVPILMVLDSWLSAPLKNGTGVEAVTEDSEHVNKPKRLTVDPFVVAPSSTVPSLDKVLPLIEAILDAHFINLLLQRQSHDLLRRLARHVDEHVSLLADLSTLLGALSIYARAKEQQRDEALLKKIAAQLTTKQRPKRRGASAHSDYAALGGRDDNVGQARLRQTALSIRAKLLRMGKSTSSIAGIDDGIKSSLNKSMESRIKAQEKHFDVPEYSVEKFYL